MTVFSEIMNEITTETVIQMIVQILICLASNVALLWFVHRRHYFGTYMVKNVFPRVGGMDSIMSAGVWCIHLAVQAAVVLGTLRNGAGGISSVLLLILAVWLFFAALIDGEKRIIPNLLLGGLLGVRAVFWALEMLVSGLPGKGQVLYQILYTFILFLLLMLVVMVAKGGFGYGDVKLLVVLSLFLDYGMLMSVLLTALIAALAFSLWLLAVRKSDRKDTIPFGPFFYMGFALNSIIMLWT